MDGEGGGGGVREIVGRPTTPGELCASAYNNIGAMIMPCKPTALPPSFAHPPFPSARANTPPCFPFRLLRMRLNFRRTTSSAIIHQFFSPTRGREEVWSLARGCFLPRAPENLRCRDTYLSRSFVIGMEENLST